MDDAARITLFDRLDFERVAGTPGELRAAEVILEALREMGLAPSLEAFPITTFTPGSARLSHGGAEWELFPYGVQGDCHIEAPFRFLENPEVLGFNVGAYRGAIVLGYGSSPRIHELLWEGGVRAFIEIAPPHRGATSLSHRQKRHAEARAVPSFTVRYDDAETLAGLDGKSVRIDARQEVAEGTGHTIVASVGAPVRDRTLTLLVAHYDSVARSHGAVDNAAGVVTALDVAGRLHRMVPDRELRVVFFSGEELGLRGSWAYVKAHEEELAARGRLVLNLDLGGDPVGVDQLFVVGTRELMGWASGVCREDGLVMRENLEICSSDNMPFTVMEIPSITIARTDGSGSFFVHTAQDARMNVGPRGIDNPVRATCAIAERVLNAVVFPVRREIDASFREKIERYAWRSTLEKPELRWRETYRR